MRLSRIFTALVALGVAALFAAIALHQQAAAFCAKTIASLAFVALGASMGAQKSRYGRRILYGLIFSCGGDIALAIPGPGPFLVGLLLFLSAHLLYIAAFATLCPPRRWIAPRAVPILISSSLALLWLWPHLDRQPQMRIPVMCYVTAITVMVSGAVALAGPGRWLIPAGAIAFYLSDLTVAQHQFIAPALWASGLGLPAYYLGQVLLAYSTADESPPA